ncbi:MAG: hypothetical protein LZF60_380081 [Nitrospira sp.]|nr:MAG: hypothetical protein LZF60_380081 [Nitrospira sp.]
MLFSSAGSKSPSIAQAEITFPLGCLSDVSGWSGPVSSQPVSSVNSRRAAASGSSPSVYSPFGIDQAPASFLAQNGPPGWTRKTSSSLPLLQYSTIPALSFLGMQILDRNYPSPSPSVYTLSFRY